MSLTFIYLKKHKMKGNHHLLLAFFSFVILLVCTSFGSALNAQTTVTFNLLSDVELSKAGEKSHYYYNEIDQENTDWRLGISQLNFLGGVVFNSNWSINSRFLVERDLGRKRMNLREYCEDITHESGSSL